MKKAASSHPESNTLQNWDLVIKPQSTLFDINFKEIWHYVFKMEKLIATAKTFSGLDLKSNVTSLDAESAGHRKRRGGAMGCGGKHRLRLPFIRQLIYFLKVLMNLTA